MPRFDSPWPEREEELRRLFQMKHPDGTPFGAGTIARRMGLTKNTVAGKLSRLGLVRKSKDETAGELVKPKQTQEPEKVQPRRYARGEPTLPPLPSLMEESKKA